MESELVSKMAPVRSLFKDVPVAINSLPKRRSTSFTIGDIMKIDSRESKTNISEKTIQEVAHPSALQVPQPIIEIPTPHLRTSPQVSYSQHQPQNFGYPYVHGYPGFAPFPVSVSSLPSLSDSQQSNTEAKQNKDLSQQLPVSRVQGSGLPEQTPMINQRLMSTSFQHPTSYAQFLSPQLSFPRLPGHTPHPDQMHSMQRLPPPMVLPPQHRLQMEHILHGYRVPLAPHHLMFPSSQESPEPRMLDHTGSAKQKKVKEESKTEGPLIFKYDNTDAVSWSSSKEYVDTHDRKPQSPLTDFSDSSIDVESTSPGSTASSGFHSNPSPTCSSPLERSSPTDHDVSQGSNQRTCYSQKQASKLKQVYSTTRYPDSETLEELSSDLRIPVRRIKVWFQNRRARDKKRSVPYMFPQSSFMMSPVPGSYGMPTMQHPVYQPYPMLPNYHPNMYSFSS